MQGRGSGVRCLDQGSEAKRHAQGYFGDLGRRVRTDNLLSGQTDPGELWPGSSSARFHHLDGSGANLPEIKIKENELKQGIKILDLLSLNKIMSSKSEARRAIKSNALKIDNKILTDENKIIQLNDFGDSKILKISFGKKKHYIIKII